MQPSNLVILNIFQRMMTSKRKNLTSVPDVIEALRVNLPGKKKNNDNVAHFMNVSKGMIKIMMRDNYLPPQHHRYIEMYLKAHGYEIDESAVFGYSTATILQQALERCSLENEARESK